MRPLSESLGRLMAALGAPERRRLTELWAAWPEVAGQELAALGKPLGHRERTLFIGAEDPAGLQELTYASPDLLSRVNAWLGRETFDKVHLDLLTNRVSLDVFSPEGPVFHPPREVRPERLGGFLGRFDPASPVGRCYEKYVRYFTGRKKRPGGRKSRKKPEA